MEIYFFAICTWPNWPVRAKILSRFQFEGKTDVWISQVRRVKACAIEEPLLAYLIRLDFKVYFVYQGT